MVAGVGREIQVESVHETAAEPEMVEVEAGPGVAAVVEAEPVVAAVGRRGRLEVERQRVCFDYRGTTVGFVVAEGQSLGEVRNPGIAEVVGTARRSDQVRELHLEVASRMARVGMGDLAVEVAVEVAVGTLRWGVAEGRSVVHCTVLVNIRVAGSGQLGSN